MKKQKENKRERGAHFEERFVWTAEFAYAFGLLTTDGNLSSDGRHMSFSSKDRELVEIFKRCLKLSNSITVRSRGLIRSRRFYVIQFGNVGLYSYFMKLGLMPRKTKDLYSLLVPNEFFFDFLRGHFDGDGSFYSYRDPRWKTSFCFFLNFSSASEPHIFWLRSRLSELLGVYGHISLDKKSGVFKLRFGKRESTIILKSIYSRRGAPCLLRKRLKIIGALDTIGVRLK